MKTFLFWILILLCSFQAKASDFFYTNNDITVKWHKGSLSSLNSNPANITHITPEAQYMIGGAGCIVNLSFLKNNKFLCLTFPGLREIMIHYYRASYSFYEVFPDIKEIFSQPWFRVDFENIFYDEASDCIVIPCSHGNTQENYLIINLGGNSDIRMIDAESSETENTLYFDLQGRIVCPSKATNEILIKKKGQSVEKIRN